MAQWKMMLLACAAAGAAGCAAGGSRDGDRQEPIRALLSTDAIMFSSFDADGDFSVTMAEADAGIARELARADANSDGSIGPIEYQTWANLVLGGSMTPPYRLDFDRNVDNVISAEEFRNELVARAQGYDTDENGAIARGELVRQVNQARTVRRAPPLESPQR